MKKYILSIFSFLLLAVAANAQKSMTTGNNTIDSAIVTNSGTGSVRAYIPNTAKSVVIQGTYLKTSGTIAGGTLVLQYSLDGVDYTTIPGQDTLTLTNVDRQAKVWMVDGNPAIYYRVLATGSGTQAGRIKAKYLARL